MNHSLRGIEVKTATSEWRKGPALRPRPGLPRIARRTEDGALTRSDPIERLAARYPVLRRLVGAPSFRVAARSFILSEPPGAPIPRSYGDTAHVQLLDARALSSLPAERLWEMRVFLHPSVCLVQSRFPVVTIWENNLTDDGDGLIERWLAEAAIVARPFLNVEVRRLPPGGYAFLSALSKGKTVATAIEIATEAFPRFNVISCLTLLDDARVVVGMQEA